MLKTDRLPPGNQTRGPQDDFAKEQAEAFVPGLQELRIEAFDDVVGERLELGQLVAMVEELEGAEAHVRRSDSRKHGGRFGPLPVDELVAAGDGERASGRNAERVHRFAAQIFANRRAQHRAPVGEPRVGGHAGAFELPLPALAVRRDDLTQCNCPPIAKLRHVNAELVPSVDRRVRADAGKARVARSQLEKPRIRRLRRVEPDQLSDSGVESDQIRIWQGGRVARLDEALAEQVVSRYDGQRVDGARRWCS